ncbi:MAG: bis(5'-nucleosyl)-tetraphosphatase (symmetrical) YqeK [Candidatus Eremiobacteraeota bacterium]|nr:bis(5'-nucleosyl)-tetraphosphatase (symmetrical) YqeK [Candidatus Eremiobacteraeota bacterium]
MRVARLGERLARRHGLCTRHARLAGMLHDLARLYSAPRLLQEAATRRLPVDDYARDHPIVLHGPLGAEIAREEFGISDEPILSAIRKHTLGAREMSALDCVVYLADGLEPGRTFAGREEILALAFENLHQAMAATLHSSFLFLREKGLAAAPQSLLAADTFGVVADSWR